MTTPNDTPPTPSGDVTLFGTCLGDMLAPQTASDAIIVLRACGLRVTAARAASCCGQPAFNAGFDAASRRVARRSLHALSRAETIVVPAGSCAAMMHRHWPHLFHGDRDQDLAKQVAGRVIEFSAFVASCADQLPPLRRAGIVTYHDSCHMLRELRLRREPRQLLARVQDLQLVEARSAERCCGFGGTFSVRYPELSVAMADAKLGDVAATGASTLVSCDGGCLLQLDGRLQRTGAAARGMHLATLLREAL